MPEFTTLHALEDLSPWIASSKVIQPSDYFTGIWDTNVFDRKAFGIPWYVDTRILFYRQDVFREAGVSEMPTTWKAWDEAMQKVKAHIGKDRFVILLPITEFEPLVILALQQKSEMLANNGTTSNFNNPDFKRAFSFYMDAFSKGYAPGVGQMQIANLYQEFEQGFFASYITGPWNVGEFKARLSPSMQGKWMTAPMPAPSEGQPNYSTAGGASLVMFRQSAHKSQAWKFMEYLSRPDVQTHFHALTGNLPPRQTAWQDSALALDPYMKAFRLQLQNTRATPKVPEWERIATEIRLMAEQVLNKKLSQDQGIAQLEQTVNRILEKRRWMMQR
jgi:multiple sugar transport system substrate-binding protein